MDIPNIYKIDYKKLAMIPIALMIISLFFITQIQLGIDFKGGTIITLQIEGDADTDSLESELINNGFTPSKIIQSKSNIGNFVEIELEQDDTLVKGEELRAGFYNYFEQASKYEGYAQGSNDSEVIVKATELRNELNDITNQMFTLAGTSMKAESIENTIQLRDHFKDSYDSIKNDYKTQLDSILHEQIDYSSISVNTVSPTLSERFIEKAAMATLISVIFSIVLAFAVFRKIAPSVAVLSGAVADMIITLGAMGLFGIPLSLPSFAALIMILGFSLDTDMLLTMRLIKHKAGKEMKQIAYETMKTGMTMSITDMIGFLVLLGLAIFGNISTYYFIASVAVIGLIGDLIATWLFNAPLLMWLLERER